MPRNKKILVTGGAGYIGSILVPALLQQKYDVVVIDNFLYKQTSLLDVCNNPSLTIIRGDARKESLMKKYVSDVDVIIPLAAIVGAEACDRNPIAAQTTNLNAIRLILKLRKKSQKIIFPNTNSGYGRKTNGLAYCTEETPLDPISLYGKLKVKAEKVLIHAGNAICLRLATVFGISPRMRLDLLVNDFVYRAISDRAVVLFEPHFKRNYIHVRDVARAFIHGITNFNSMKNETYNVGLSDTNISKYELCEEIKKQVKNFVFIVSDIGEDPDKRNYIVSNKKIERAGFSPEVSLQDGITELIKGYQVVKKDVFSNL